MSNVSYRNCCFLKEARQSDFTRQADEVLANFNIHLTLSHLRTGESPHFDDGELRNVYRWTLMRTNPGTKRRVRVWGEFYDSIKSTRDNERPTAYDILSCLTHYDPGSFEDFCCECGYLPDSRAAEKTYRAVVREWAKVSRMFDTHEALEALRTIA